MDDLDKLIEEATAKNPTFKLHMQDAGRRFDIVGEMRRARINQGLTQLEVAERLSIKQPAVSEFEAGRGDFYLSTLQNYARAIGGSIKIEFIPNQEDSSCGG